MGGGGGGDWHKTARVGYEQVPRSLYPGSLHTSLPAGMCILILCGPCLVFSVNVFGPPLAASSKDSLYRGDNSLDYATILDSVRTRWSNEQESRAELSL